MTSNRGLLVFAEKQAVLEVEKLLIIPVRNAMEKAGISIRVP